jgi:hypothetical protein
VKKRAVCVSIVPKRNKVHPESFSILAQAMQLRARFGWGLTVVDDAKAIVVDGYINACT